ncbi:MAG: LysE family transporter [Actinomycetota bacterium]
MTLQFLLLGFGVGLLTMMPPGPVTMTLIEVGVAQGRHRGAQGAVGVAAGDLVTGLAASSIVLLGASTLPGPTFAVLQAVSAVLLIVFGAALVLRPSAVRRLALGLQHPARALFMITTLTPTVLGAWVVIIGAMPFADQGSALVQFVLGAAVASLVWHTLLGSAAGELGHRLTEQRLAEVTMAGGVALAAFGGFMLAG